MLGVRTCATLLALALGGCESSSLSWHPQDDDGTTGADGGSSGSVVDSDTKTAADRYAHARCTAMFACPCTPHHYDDIDQCELAITQLVHNATTELFADPRCLDRVIEELETQSCETLAQLSATVSPCRLYAGSAAVGEPCASIAIGGPFARSDGCAIGLTCSFGTCIDEDDPPQLPPELAEDAPCGPEIEGVCADGLHCDDTVGRCAPRISDGGACEELGSCVSGSYCAGLAADVGTCQPKVEVGGACDPTDVYACAAACIEDGSVCEWVDCVGVCEPPSAWVCGGDV